MHHRLTGRAEVIFMEFVPFLLFLVVFRLGCDLQESLFSSILSWRTMFVSASYDDFQFQIIVTYRHMLEVFRTH